MKKLRILLLTIFFLSAQAYILSNVFPAILAFSIALYTLYLYLEFNPKLEVKREINKPLYEGKKSICKLLIRNLTEKGYIAEFYDELPHGFQGERLNFVIGAHEEKELKYTIIPIRGVYKISGILAVRDLREIFCKKLQLEDVKIEVLPSIERLKEEMKTNLNLELTRKSIIGSEREFHSLREFQSGDDTRRIDWKASARLGELIVKEFLKEWEGDVYIALDTSREMRKKFDHAIKIVFQLVNSIKGKKIGLVVYDEIGIKKIVKANDDTFTLLKELKISPIKAKQSLKTPEIRIPRTITRWIKKLPTTSLSLIKSIPKKSAVIFITDLANPDLLLRALIEIRKTCLVLVFALNPVLFYSGELNRETLLKLYEAYLSREKLIKKINSIVPTIDLGPKDSISEIGGYPR
ncbi:MAG: DUF58 domain-containing protein [Archaeoglobaceae archaeon]